MPNYKYWAKKGPSENIEGVIEASSEDDAVDKITKFGLLPIKIKEAKEAGKSKQTSSFLSSRKIKSKDITAFSRQLASFLKSGMTIIRSLDVIYSQTENIHLKEILFEIKAQIKEGQAFSLALANYPKLFSPIYIAMVHAGESGGSLPEALTRISTYRQKQEEIASKVKTALAYPGVMVFVAVATTIFMFAFVIPRLMNIFSRLGSELPAVTRILIYTSKGFRSFGPFLLLISGVLFFIGRSYAQSEKGQKIISRIKLKLPIFGKLHRQLELARFSRTLAVLLDNGLSMLKAVKIATPTLDNTIMRQEVLRSSKELEEGGSFGKALEQSPIFPLFMTNLLIMGEESSKLTESLFEVAAAYERQTEETVRTMTTLLEPLIIIVVGLIVGFIVIAMLLPIFQMDLMS